MGESFIESISDRELNTLREQAATGGEFEAARGLLEREAARRQALGDYDKRRIVEQQELERRARIVQARQAVEDAYVVPVDPMEGLECEGCQ